MNYLLRRTSPLNLCAPFAILPAVLPSTQRHRPTCWAHTRCSSAPSSTTSAASSTSPPTRCAIPSLHGPSFPGPQNHLSERRARNMFKLERGAWAGVRRRVRRRRDGDGGAGADQPLRLLQGERTAPPLITPAPFDHQRSARVRYTRAHTHARVRPSSAPVETRRTAYCRSAGPRHDWAHKTVDCCQPGRARPSVLPLPPESA
jgi:hypothetical protein